jgi:hypothetical protein
MRQGSKPVHAVVTERAAQIFLARSHVAMPAPVCRIEQQTSAAAEGCLCQIPLLRFASLEVLVRRKRSACSSAVENFKSPQHHDGGRYQRGHRQHTLQGSDSHFTLRFPSPKSRSSRFVESRAIGRPHLPWFCREVVVCGAQGCSPQGTGCSTQGKGPDVGPLTLVVPEQRDQQNDRQRYAQQPQQRTLGEIHVFLLQRYVLVTRRE